MSWNPKRSTLIVALCATAIAGAHAADRTKLDGWGPFKFSMSFNEAKAAAGADAVIVSPEMLRYDTSIDGVQWTAEVSYTGAGGKMTSVLISLTRPPASSASDCDQKHTQLATRIAEAYGKQDDDKGIKSDANILARQSFYRFKDGAQILVTTTYPGDAAPASARTCRQAVNYMAPRTVPTGKF